MGIGEFNFYIQPVFALLILSMTTILLRESFYKFKIVKGLKVKLTSHLYKYLRR